MVESELTFSFLWVHEPSEIQVLPSNIYLFYFIQFSGIQTQAGITLNHDIIPYPIGHQALWNYCIRGEKHRGHSILILGTMDKRL